MSIPQSGGGPIERREQLAEYLAEGCKPEADFRIGTEHEKFGYLRDSHAPLPYAGPASIHAMLDGLRERFGWTPIEEAGELTREYSRGGGAHANDTTREIAHGVGAELGLSGAH